jgi:hypothetical protein
MYVRLAFAVAAHLEPEILVVDEVLAVLVGYVTPVSGYGIFSKASGVAMAEPAQTQSSFCASCSAIVVSISSNANCICS